MGVLVELVRAYLAIILTLAALAKFVHREHFVKAIASYKLLPLPLIVPFSYAVPLTEFALAVCVGSGSLVPSAEITTACLVSVFTGAVLIRLARGERGKPCGCGLGRNVRLGLDIVLRNIFLIALAIAAVGGGPAETPALVLAASILLVRTAAVAVSRRRAKAYLLAELN